MIKIITSILLLSISNLTALETYKEFFSNFCTSCHGAEKKKGGVRLHELTWDPANSDSLELWRDLIDQIEIGEMPPENKKQPSQQEVDKLIADIKSRFIDLQSSAKVVLRRLNKKQYVNTIRDLMHVDTLLFDPAKGFPADDEYDGYTNVADGQKMSSFLLSSALKSSGTIIDRAKRDITTGKAQTIIMGKTPNPPKQGKIQDEYFKRIKLGDTGQSHINIYLNDETTPGDLRGSSVITSIMGVPHDGRYEYEFEVESKGRGNAPQTLLATRTEHHPQYYNTDLHRLEIYLVRKKDGKSLKDFRGFKRVLLESIDLEDNKRYTIKRSYDMRQGWKIQLCFANGPVWHGPAYYQKVSGEKPPEFKSKKEKRAYEQNNDKRKLNKIIEEKNLPRITLHNGSRKGPFYENWPPKSHQQLFEGDVEKNIHSLAQRAFRRPITNAEADHYVRIAKNGPEGFRTAIQAILCSPKFLYIVEKSEDKLNHYEVANRLSYMFWNTMPDAELFKLAAQKKLQDHNVIQSQALRMLKDPKGKEFIEGFVWSWLKLQSTIEMAPDSMLFNDYTRYKINNLMLDETNLFFQDILDNNKPLSTFVNADYSFVNADLARRYGIDGVSTTAKFQKVKIAENSRRRGLFGQTSVLTASANGTDTSPVLRGIWILENLLGIHPPPPPDDVDIPEIDLRGEYTLKELYAKHRNVEGCNSCHVKIDPLGFALENFDAAGRWRDLYKNNTKVDSTGKMPDGTPFEGLFGLKKNLLKDMTHFNRNLTNELLKYAAGRKMKATDRVIIDKLTEKTLQDNYGLKDLLLDVVTSDIFLNK